MRRRNVTGTSRTPTNHINDCGVKHGKGNRRVESCRKELQGGGYSRCQPERKRAKIYVNNREALVSSMCRFYEHIVERNRKVPSSAWQMKQFFHLLAVPEFSVTMLLERLAEDSECSDEALVMAVVYVDKLIKKFREAGHQFILNGHTIHMVLVAAILVASKVQDDIVYNNKDFGNIAGLNIKDINKLERNFLARLNFEVHVSRKEYEIYKSELLKK